ncbi:GDSL-type esterase/lipase family protein [Duganella phyllosphaerae]|uniref:GDSL-like lipase/acylhydrolase n=1 Tax=Duganella phyllosphaerae TaxID=762836 RepID=A0A1E7X5Z9_9BURK|nr:GDSL-type esterase/lipase family protein [Duganella phyllosphaerae]OFA08371.1 GDSL-like lipase/acylhydrolase [Duganella phyllosphaerae]
MMSPIFRTLLLAAALLANPAFAQTNPHESASIASPKKDDGKFLKKHEINLARAKSGPVGLLFLGDSITDNWRKAPEIWDKYYGKYQPANFGIGGDRTQHVIWRIEHGELDGIAPKVTVLMIGTNNSLDYSAADIAAANRKIVDMVRARLPGTKVLLLGVFPRGPRDRFGGPVTPAFVAEAAKRMDTIRAVNKELAQLDDGKTVRFLDITGVFLDQDGKIPDAVMPDQLHPNAAGYQLWADAMQPLLEQMMTAP